MADKPHRISDEILLPDGTPWLCPRKADTMMVWREIFDDGVYAEAASNVPPFGTIIDVGAHTGLAALYFSRNIDSPRIFAFEPAAELYKCLSINLRRYVDVAKAYRLALGNDPGVRPFTYYPDAPSQSGIYADAFGDREATMAYLSNNGVAKGDAEYLSAEVHTPRTEFVNVVTLSSMFSDRELAVIDLLKIDVERAELDVLEGIADYDWCRIRSVIMEVHNENSRLYRCESLLRSRGYTVIVEQVPWLANSRLFNVVATR